MVLKNWLICHFNDSVVNGKCEMESQSQIELRSIFNSFRDHIEIEHR